MVANSFADEMLTELWNRTPVRHVPEEERIVIFSDLHMGNGRRMDDFVHNSDLFVDVLTEYYAPQGFHLILNGDVEELQRFPMAQIVPRWRHVYDAFGRMAAAGGLTRLVGNHDLDLLEGGPSLGLAGQQALRAHPDWPEIWTEPLYEALRLDVGAGEIFVFHGHQTSRWFQHHNDTIRLILKYIANPLGINNYTVAADSRRQFAVEERAYQFAASRKVMAVIGHTHRPLFESMSKRDSIQFEIERLCRKYPKSRKRERIERRVHLLKAELLEERTNAQSRRATQRESLYEDLLLVPCLFNSGCVLGKRGMTSLEIEGGMMRLVYWYDPRRPQKLRLYDTGVAVTGDLAAEASEREADQADTEAMQEAAPSAPAALSSAWRRTVITEESLDYIFSRISLLA